MPQFLGVDTGGWLEPGVQDQPGNHSGTTPLNAHMRTWTHAHAQAEHTDRKKKEREKTTTK